jgi:phage-related minor tail protein
VVDGKRLEDVLRSLALSLSRQALNAALAPLSKGIGGFFASLFAGRFALGGIVGPGVMPFAQGGVVASPSYFPMRGGLGLVGARRRSCRSRAAPTGGSVVRAAGGAGGLNVTFNVSTPDAQSFRRAEAELTAMLARAVGRGQRGL